MYISVGCNRVAACVDMHPSGVVAACVANSIVIFNAVGGQTLAIGRGHTGQAECVAWVDATTLVSGGADHTCRVWRRDGDTRLALVGTLTGHTETVVAISALRIAANDGKPACTLVASAAGDGSTRLWREQCDGNFEELASFTSPKHYTNAVTLRLLWGADDPEGSTTSRVVMATGGTQGTVQVYVAREDGSAMQLASTLVGHADWIRSAQLSYAPLDDGDWLLATADQDAIVRLWRLHIVAAATTASPPSLSALSLADKLIGTPRQVSTAHGITTTITLESVVCGHEERIYSVRWQPPQPPHERTQPLSLLTSSMDKTVLLWRPERDSGVWVPVSRLGDLGGNTLGFYGAVISAGGQAIVAHNGTGKWFLWALQQQSKADEEEGEGSGASSLLTTSAVVRYQSQPTMTGHSAAVHDIAWSPTGEGMVLSTGDDQTTRLHVALLDTATGERGWCELARPQVHGHDLHTVSFVGGSPLRFVSGAEEKILRLFAATSNFCVSSGRLAGLAFSEQQRTVVALGASVPALGLSNKAVFESDVDGRSATVNAFDEENPASYSFNPLTLERPPTETDLLQNTLWPETHKMYGHGDEISCVAAHGKWIASACKARTDSHASVIVWATATGMSVQTLRAHSLTVTQLCFSPNGRFLLSVSRDRHWSLFVRRPSISKEGEEEESEPFVLVERVKAHERILWACAWHSDSLRFATASRDKTVRWWRIEEGGDDTSVKVTLVSTIGPLADSATAVAVLNDSSSSAARLLIGLDNGQLVAVEACDDASAFGPCTSIVIPDALPHSMTITRILSCPTKPNLIATCGADHAVKICQL